MNKLNNIMTLSAKTAQIMMNNVRVTYVGEFPGAHSPVVGVGVGGEAFLRGAISMAEQLKQWSSNKVSSNEINDVLGHDSALVRIYWVRDNPG